MTVLQQTDERPIGRQALRNALSERVLAVPAESLRRDPAGYHKRAYVRLIADAFGADLLRFRNEAGAIRDVLLLEPSLVLTFNIPWYDRYSDWLIRVLPESTRLVTIHDDCRRQMHPALAAVLDRSDAVIAPIREPVLRNEQFPGISRKFWRLPYFVPGDAPHYAVNSQAQRKCVVAGATGPKYRLRTKALRELPQSLIARLPHPGYWRASYREATVGAAYFEFLNNHVCGLTCGSTYGYVVMKYLEIPYCGALLIAEDLPDLAEMGYEAGTHFVPVDQETNLGRLVGEVCSCPTAFRRVRESGQKLVEQRHTEQARWRDARRMAAEILRTLGLPLTPSESSEGP